MGSRADRNWIWQLQFRRSLYQWEEMRKEELLLSLSHTTERYGRGSDSVGSFKRWKIRTPPKVEMLVWRLYHDSLPTRDILARKEVLSSGQNLNCELCDQHVESVDHLLLICKWSWRLWTWCLRWWGFCWVVPPTMKDLLQGWVIPKTSKTYKRFWKTLCHYLDHLGRTE
ncbi:unnamed protein product [Rhodiola kirilowii]